MTIDAVSFTTSFIFRDIEDEVWGAKPPGKAAEIGERRLPS